MRKRVRGKDPCQVVDHGSQARAGVEFGRGASEGFALTGQRWRVSGANRIRGLAARVGGAVCGDEG